MHGQRQVFSVQVLKINYLKTPFIFLFGFFVPMIGRVWRWGFIFQCVVASGPLAGITLLWGTRGDHWPYTRLRDVMGAFHRAHFKCSPGTLSLSPWCNPHFFANLQLSQEWLLQTLPSAGKFLHFSFPSPPHLWKKLAVHTAAWAGGFWHFWTVIFLAVTFPNNS